MASGSPADLTAKVHGKNTDATASSATQTGSTTWRIHQDVSDAIRKGREFHMFVDIARQWLIEQSSHPLIWAGLPFVVQTVRTR